MERTGSTTTIANEFASIPQHDQTGTNDNANPNDQTNFVKPNDQQLVKPRETGQLMPMTADNLNLASSHEADNVEQFVMIPTPNMRQINAENRVNSKSNSKSGEKIDFGAAESINEASPSTVQRKRGRPKTLKIHEKNTMGKSKMGVEKPSMKSAKGKSKMTESLPSDQADVAIPTRILGMLLYENNKRRAFFVEWDDCQTESPCWVQSDDINALALVTDFIVKCSIDSVLSAFSGGPVMSHVAKLLEKKAKALMKSIGKDPAKLATVKIVFSKSTTQMEKDMALMQKDKFIKSIKGKLFLHYLRFNRIFEYCNEHEHLGKKCHYFYIDIIGEYNDDGKVSTDCFKLLFHNPSPAQRVQEKSTSEFAIKELNLGILLEQHLKLAKEKIKCVTVEQGIGKMGEKVEAEIGKKCQQWGKKGIDEKRPKDRKRWEDEKKVVNGVDHFMQM
ncbi:hypothetical protein niasHS_006988 [Heterodera schachtii]|uniref:Chromo domain-containing protein n=1 Tax=Heterodera schachtii TaxID=97005 RepID=A0ABD2JFB4_HETSC